MKLISVLVFFLWCGCGLYKKDQSESNKGESAQSVKNKPIVTDFRTKERLNILAFGDFGFTQGLPDEPLWRVGQAMTKVCETEGCDFALGLGDNFYQIGVQSVEDQAFKTCFEDPYKDLNIPFYMTLGNHDYKGVIQAQIDYTLRSSKWVMPAKFYAVPELPEWFHAFALDTNIIVGKNDPTEELLAAKNHLCPQKGWKLLFGHHPPYSNSMHGKSERIRNTVLPLMEECGVQLLLNGHAHILELFNNADKYFAISGSAGQLMPLDENVELDGVSVVFKAAKYGFILIKADPSTLILEYYDDLGVLLHTQVIE